jgi:hypothetical protein
MFTLGLDGGTGIGGLAEAGVAMAAAAATARAEAVVSRLIRLG